jgi:hypothetical protein
VSQNRRSAITRDEQHAALFAYEAKCIVPGQVELATIPFSAPSDATAKVRALEMERQWALLPDPTLRMKVNHLRLLGVVNESGGVSRFPGDEEANLRLMNDTNAEFNPRPDGEINSSPYFRA